MTRPSKLLGILAILSVGMLCISGCEKKGAPGTPAPSTGSAPAAPAGGPAAPAAAPAAGATELDPAKVTNGAIISGVVKVTGEVPPPVAVSIEQKPECVAAHGGGKTIPSEGLLASGGNLKDAVVFIKKGLEKYTFPAPTGTAVIDQKGCVYVPHVFLIRVKQDLEIRSSDPFQHNVNVKENNPFNMPFPAGAKPEIRPAWFRKEGPTKFACDVHPWMNATAYVTANPYAAISGADGKFTLPPLPAGKYTLAVWHEAYPGLTAPAQKEVEIEVKDGETKTHDFTFSYAK